jgi:DNA-binding NarL/FixJ family response regulator
VTTPVRVLVADDHAVIRDGIAAMLQPRDDFVLVGQAADGDAAIRLAARLRPDVVLMDLRMPGTDGVAATATITAGAPGARVLVLTTYDDDSNIVRAMAAGAIGYLLKDTPRAELFTAIHAAAQGQTTLTPSVATKLIRQLHTPPPEALSAREHEVLTLVAGGATNREIARVLNVTEATVKTYLTRVFAKLDVGDRTAAVTAALARGLITIGSGTSTRTVPAAPGRLRESGRDRAR